VLPRLYEPCAFCGGAHPTAKGTQMSELYKTEILKLAKAIYESKKSVNYNPEMLKATAENFINAVRKGYGESFVNADWNTPDKAMIDKLQQNVWQFSAAKNYQQLRDIGGAMTDENGNLLEFSDFEEQVKNLNYKYNRTWLETEYDNAISAATSAAHWSEFEQNADTMPMLQYQTIGDNKVREAHRLLNGTTKPINDTFWKTYYPPNGWRCRCEAIQLPTSSAKVVEPQGLPDVPQMFRTNLAQNGLIFPKGHPYFDGVPKDILRRSMQYIPQENAWNIRKEYEEHAMVQYEGEATENREIAKLLYESGERNIRLMPRLEEHEQEVRKIIYGEEYAQTHERKCPDSFIGNEATEFKRCIRKQAKRRLEEAAQQANTALIEITETMTQKDINEFVAPKWQNKKCSNLIKILIINKGKVYKYQRP
jgi:SPP1 gp7 family putative phage head morphogenesis protein